MHSNTNTNTNTTDRQGIKVRKPGWLDRYAQNLNATWNKNTNTITNTNTNTDRGSRLGSQVGWTETRKTLEGRLSLSTELLLLCLQSNALD